MCSTILIDTYSSTLLACDLLPCAKNTSKDPVLQLTGIRRGGRERSYADCLRVSASSSQSVVDIIRPRFKPLYMPLGGRARLQTLKIDDKGICTDGHWTSDLVASWPTTTAPRNHTVPE
jgi:hypothetical protein